MIPHPIRLSAHTSAEAGAWADVLARRRLLNATVLTPTGPWLVQQKPDGPVHVLSGPTDVIELAATIQHRICSQRCRTR